MSNKIVCPNCLAENFSEFQIKNNDNRVYKGRCKSCNQSLKFRLKSDKNGLLERDSISFFINGKQYTIQNEYPFSMTLNDYLRNVLNMTGTKVTCREGGCGSCIINAEIFDYETQQPKDITINTCLLPLYSCDQIKFTTIEGIGSKQNGFSDIQKRIADYNGSQCGWCTPGMVMSMYGLLLNNPKPSKQLIENSFDGNICRCTGYRSILDAMKSFASDEKPIDIEELSKLKCLNDKKCFNVSDKKIHIINETLEWFTPNNLNDLFALLTEYQTSSYKLVGGNTGTGVYKNDGPFDIFIDIKNVPDLHQVTRTPNLLAVGSSVQLKNLIDLMNEYSSTSGFEYLTEIANHLTKIANVPVRNAASWSGNIMMKYNHNEFPSDIFVCLETVDATVTIVGPSANTPPITCRLSQFLTLPLQGRLVFSANFTPLNKNYIIVKTYKIMPRSQNAHAYVNAGFKFSVDPNTNKLIGWPNIVFGGLSKNFIHAEKTESFLNGKILNDINVLSQAFQILSNELVIDDDPVLASIEYRKSLALSLFYKFILFINDKYVGVRYKSAKDSIIDMRPISSGQQSFPTDPTLYPVSKPIKKLNAYLQASGEAQYVYDQEFNNNRELQGAFIQSSIANCQIDSIDTSIADSMPGVVKIIFAKDIPGVNSFVPTPLQPEKLFCDDFVDYNGQVIGLVVAETYEQAKNAANAVKISYKNIQKPLLNVFDAINAGSFFPKPINDFIVGDPDSAIQNAPFTVQNEVLLDTQYPFFMENHVAIVEPTDDGFDVDVSTQWLDLVQNGIAQVLNIPNSSCINVKTKQIGGGYGGKITRPNIVATAAALACKLLNRPVRVALDMNSSMELIGKRFPWYAKYKIGFDQSGKLLGIIVNFYCDSGNSPNDNAMGAGPLYVDNTYMCKNWKIIANLCKTNLPANTATRSPGFFPSIAIMESMIENVAKYLNADPLKLRQINLYKKGDTTPAGQPLPYFIVDELINELIVSSDYVNRLNAVNDFNKNNRWKKKGISLTPIKWGVGWTGGYYNCIISIYASDGSVSLSHGGVEIGQGIHTKVSQVCAYSLGIPMEIISIKHTNNLTNPNGQATGGSITSELCSMAVIECCKILNANLDPVRKIMPPNSSWQQLIAKAFSMGVDLSAHYWLYPPALPMPFEYNVYGAGVSEAIVDVLTGETQILRTDILYDGGQSLNASIDIGQAEGAFIMGLGFWLLEKVRYDPITGKNLSNGTWEYKVPTTKDIPIDFRINFLMKNPNPLGVLGSKCIGEPPLCLSPCVAFAVKRAIEAARNEIGKDTFFPLNSPATVESIQQLCLVDSTQFKLTD